MRFTLTASRDRQTVSRRFLDDTTPLLIVGRGEDCGLRLESRNVSRHHCEVFLRAGRHVVRDLGSSNGTLVNGERVRERVLAEGDQVTVGEFTLFYAPAQERPASRGASALEDGLDDTLRMKKGSAASEAPAAVSAPGPRPIARLEVASDAPIIVKKSAFLIGAAPGADLRLTQGGAPPFGAAILRDGDGFLAVDLSPRRDCLRVDGERVARRPLADGAALQVGALDLRFRLGVPRLS